MWESPGELNRLSSFTWKLRKVTTSSMHRQGCMLTVQIHCHIKRAHILRERTLILKYKDSIQLLWWHAKSLWEHCLKELLKTLHPLTNCHESQICPILPRILTKFRDLNTNCMKIISHILSGRVRESTPKIITNSPNWCLSTSISSAKSKTSR